MRFQLTQVRTSRWFSLATKQTEKKSDIIRRQVSFEEATDFAKKHKLKYFETSAKNNFNVYECFCFVSEMILENIANQKIDPKNEVY